MSDYDAGKMAIHIDHVRLGVRSVAHMTLRWEMLPDARKAIEAAGLRMLVTPAGESHADLYIFAHEHLREVIVQANAAPEPLRDWARGRLFGYSEAAIATFVGAGRDSAGSNADRPSVA